MTQSWRVRAVEYEVVPRHLVSATTGLSAYHVERRLGWMPDVALVKCVDEGGTRFTALGDSQNLGDLLPVNGPDHGHEMALATNRWPIVIRGWLS